MLFFVSLIAFACTMGVWLFKSGASLRTGLESNLGPNLFSKLDKSAADAGFANGGPFSLKWTILAGTWVYINLVFNQSSAYIGGEVKRASRTQLWTMPAVAIASVAFLLLMLALADNALGLTTMGELAASQGLLFTQIAAFGSDSTFLAILILGAFIFASYTWLPGQITNASRTLLAYSIHGIVPRFIGTVHKRYHTPWVALLIMGVGSIAALAAYVWVPDFATL